MIPLRDLTRSNSFPFVNLTFITINILAFLYEQSLGKQLNEFIYQYGLVPSFLFSKENITITQRFSPFKFSMFLHGGWMHLIGNILFLYIFGKNVEDRMGHIKYFFFYLAVGIIAAVFQIATNLKSTIPMVGASGAISGVLGAYLLFLPRSRILTLVPIFIFIHFMRIPAAVFILIWFAFQLLSGVGILSISQSMGGVAFWAHIGGFIGGLMLAKSFQKKGYKILGNFKTKYYH